MAPSNHSTNFITLYYAFCALRDNQVNEITGQISIILDKIVSVAILSALTLSFQLGSNLYFYKYRTKKSSKSMNLRKLEAWCWAGYGHKFRRF